MIALWTRRLPTAKGVARWPASRIALAVLALAAAIAAAMAWADAPVYAFVKGLSESGLPGSGLPESGLPESVRAVFRLISDAGKSGWFLVPAGVCAILAVVAMGGMSGAADRVTRGVLAAIAVRAGFVFAAVGLPGLMVQLAKRLIGRRRPSGLGPYVFEPGAWQAAFHSMPSGHSATAVSVAISLGALWPRARPVLWLYALLVIVSRIVLMAHYPSDVIGGAAVGALGAIMVREAFAARRLGFKAYSAAGSAAMAGPSLQRIKRVARRVIGL